MLLLAPVCAQAQPEKPVIFGDFEVEDIYGEARDQTLITGAKLSFINVWGTYCGPCIEEMPFLAELAEEYKDEVQFIGIVCDVRSYGGEADPDLLKLAVQIADETGASAYPHLIPNDAMIERVLGGIQAIPTSFFLDAEGRQVGSAVVGSNGKEDWMRIIDEALAQVEG